MAPLIACRPAAFEAARDRRYSDGADAAGGLSWLSTIVFLPVFGLVMVVFDVAQRIARLFGQRPQEYVAGALQWTLVRTFGICGHARCWSSGRPRSSRGTSYIIVSNHQSMFDIADPGLALLLELPEVHLEALARPLDPERVVQPARGRPRADRPLRRAGGARGDPRPRPARARRRRLRDDLPRRHARPRRRARAASSPPARWRCSRKRRTRRSCPSPSTNRGGCCSTTTCRSRGACASACTSARRSRGSPARTARPSSSGCATRSQAVLDRWRASEARTT